MTEEAATEVETTDAPSRVGLILRKVNYGFVAIMVLQSVTIGLLLEDRNSSEEVASFDTWSLESSISDLANQVDRRVENRVFARPGFFGRSTAARQHPGFPLCRQRSIRGSKQCRAGGTQRRPGNQ